MSERTSNHEPDDELLSAYLDGELTEVERAAVEARLASDPDAKHTLQQLRMVSQSVQALPQEPIGRDLRERVLRRAEQMKPAARSAVSDGSESRLGDTLPQITILRTRRSWVWASIVVAAGLLIMFLQSGDERGRNLPPVANRDNGRLANAPADVPVRRSLDEAAPVPAIDPAQMASTEARAPMASGISSAPPPPSDSAPLAPGESAPPTSVAANRSGVKRASPPAGPIDSSSKDKSRDIASNGEMAGATIAAASPAPANRVDMGTNRESKLALGDPGKAAVGKPPLGRELGAERSSSPSSGVTGGGRAGGGALSRAAGTRREPANAPNRLVVVHVVAKPEAFKNKTFDQLLVKNGIDMESRPQTGDGIDATADRLSNSLSETEKVAGKLADAEGSNEPVVDLVLVEAPQSAITSCMTSLKNDSENYVGIEVDQPPTDRDKVDSNSLRNKKGAGDLSSYGRGVVTERQKDLFRKRKIADEIDTFGGSTDGNGGLGGGRGGADDVLKEKTEHEPLGQQQASVANQGRARRYFYSYEQNRRGGDAGGASDAPRGNAQPQTAKQLPVLQDRKATAKEEAVENVHVLFVVSPDSAAAVSGPTQKAAK